MVKLDKYLKQEKFDLKDEEIKLVTLMAINDFPEDKVSYSAYGLKHGVDAGTISNPKPLDTNDFNIVFKIEPKDDGYGVKMTRKGLTKEIGVASNHIKGRGVASEYMGSIFKNLSLEDAKNFLEGEPIGSIGYTPQGIANYLEGRVIETENYKGLFKNIHGEVKGESLRFTSSVTIVKKRKLAPDDFSKEFGYENVLLHTSIDLLVAKMSLKDVCDVIIQCIENSGGEQERLNHKLDKYFKEG